MVDDYCAGRLLGCEHKFFCKLQPDILWLKQIEELRLIFKVRTCWIAKRISCAVIFRAKKKSHLVGLLIGDTHLHTHLPVPILGQGLSGFDPHSVGEQVVLKIAILEQAALLNANLGSDGYDLESNRVHWAADRVEEI